MSFSGPHHRGAKLPYTLLAGVIPSPAGWLLASARLQGISIYPQEPETFGRFINILDYKPALQVIALHAPIGLLDHAEPGGRACDRAARKLLRWPRSAAIQSPPSRAAVHAEDADEAARIDGGMSVVTKRRLTRIAEVTREMQPYWQRTVFEVHPELSFYQLNDDAPLRYSKRTKAGVKERRTLLEARIPGVERIIDAEIRGVTAAHLLDAAATLWTARRIVARAVTRLPEDPEWDAEGLRREIVR